MAHLADVNLLLALVTDRHVHHLEAVRWTNETRSDTIVVCRTVQIGLLRLLNNPAVMGEEALPSGLDESFERYTQGRAFSPRLWSDAYLAAYASTGGHTLVTY